MVRLASGPRATPFHSLTVAVMLAFGLGLAACGERAAVFRGTITGGSLAELHYDDTLNPAKNSPISGARLFVKIGTDHFHPSCRVPASAKPNATSNAEGVFDTDVIGWGPAGTDSNLQLCFVKTGYATYEHRIASRPKPHETNGEKYMNVVLVVQ